MSADFLSDPIENELRRRQEFQSFIRLINFDNTTTEIELMLKPAQTHASDVFSELLAIDRTNSVARGNRFLDIAHRLKFTVREDPLKVLYPPYFIPICSGRRHGYQLSRQRNTLLDQPFESYYLAGEKIPYVFKKIDRPFYQLEDSAVIQQELQNLRLSRGAPNIVQFYTIVISPNPY